jgi:hypothetical protein
MLETYLKGSPTVEVSDGTVAVLPGGVRLGNTFSPFRGGRINFSSMVSYGTDSSKYQNSLLFLNPLGQGIDMTASVSTPVATLRELTLPVLPSDSSNPYSVAYPLGLFTFYSNDGTSVSLISSTTV